MNKLVMRINIIFLVLLAIALILLLTGCATTKKDPSQNGGRVIAYDKQGR